MHGSKIELLDFQKIKHKLALITLAICFQYLVQCFFAQRHKIGHFGDVPQANLLAWYGKTKPNTTKAHIH